MGVYQTKKPVHSKNNKMKKQPIEQEKITVNHKSDKYSISKLY